MGRGTPSCPRATQYWAERDLWYTDPKSTKFRNKDKMKDSSSQERVEHTQAVNQRAILNKLIKEQRTSKMHQHRAARGFPAGLWSKVTGCRAVAPGHGAFQTPCRDVISRDENRETSAIQEAQAPGLRRRPPALPLNPGVLPGRPASKSRPRIRCEREHVSLSPGQTKELDHVCGKPHVRRARPAGGTPAPAGRSPPSISAASGSPQEAMGVRKPAA